MPVTENLTVIGGILLCQRWVEILKIRLTDDFISIGGP